MDKLFSVVSLTAGFSLGMDTALSDEQSQYFVVSTELVGDDDLRSLVFGADTVLKHLLDDTVPLAIVLVDDCSVGGGFVRVFENVYLCSMNYSVLSLTASSFYLVNHAFCDLCLSVKPMDVSMDALRSVCLPLRLSSSWFEQHYNENGLLCYAVEVKDSVSLVS